MKPEGYFVWNPEHREPQFQHKHVDSAVGEAERLAKQHPGQQFIVLKAIGYAKVERPATFVWAPGCERETEVPF